VAGSGRLAGIADELERICEQLADAAMDLLRAALDESEAAAALATKRERVLNRARSSVEKARLLVLQADSDPGEA
jgi:exonuclease VII small subunit